MINICCNCFIHDKLPSLTNDSYYFSHLNIPFYINPYLLYMGSCLIRSRISYGAKPIKKPFLIDREKVCNRILYAYKLSPKSALNFATNFSGQSEVADNFPQKNRSTLGSS